MERIETPITEEEVKDRWRAPEDVLAEVERLDGQQVSLSFPHWRRVGINEMKPTLWTATGVLTHGPDERMRDLTDERGPHDWIALRLDGHWATYLDEMVMVETVDAQPE